MTKQTKTKAARKASTGQLNAGQRLQVAEETIGQLKRMIDLLAKEVDKLNEVNLEIAQRLEAAILAGESGSLTQKAVNDKVVENKIKELKATIQTLVDKGVLKPEQKVGREGLIAGKELNKDGTVIHERIQKEVSSIPKEALDILDGKSVGDLVDFGDGKFQFLIEEFYSINKENIAQGQVAQS